MALRIKDRVKQGTTTTGSGTINLDVSFSSSGFQDFSVLGNGTETYYAIEEGSNFEIGLGTYSSNTLSRSTILDSSNGGAKIALNGNANVFVTYPADKAVFTDADNNATVTGLIVGQTGVKFNDGTIQTTAFDGNIGGYDFTVSDGSNSEVISSGSTVIWTGVGNTTVSYDTGTNTFSVSGTDQDLSSYATEAYVTGVSGDLQTQITTNANNIASTGATNAAAIAINSTDISTVSGLTVTNANNISSNDTDISNLSGLVATNTSDISTVSGLTVTNSNDIDTVSGLTVTNATNISNNSTDISTVSGLTVTNSNDIDTVSGLTVTNANNISTNSTDIDTVSGLTVTNANNISSNSTDIGTVSGLTVTNANNISTNSTDIDTVSGIAAGKDNYQYWTITDGSNSENIQSTNTVKFTGEGNTTVSYDSGSNTVSISGTAGGGGGGYDFTVSDGSNSEVVASGDSVTWTGTGATTVSYNTGSNTFTINTPSSEAGYEGWTATDGNATSEIANGNDVKITGAGNVTVSFVSGSPNVFTVSGADQDLSSYATEAYVTGVSGHLQGQIDTNSTDISTNSSNITTVSGLTDTNATNINTVSGLTVTNATDISTVSGLTVTNATDIDTVSGLTVTNATDIDTVSGLLYTSWTVTDGSNSEAIAGGDQVKFTGAGATTVAYSTANNTVTVTSTDNNTEYTAGTGLQLVGTEFNVSGIDSSMIVNGSVANEDLANSSVTVTAGTGLSNGGAVSLGSSITIDADTATTSQVGVVQLQDSATDGTTDKAITPNAVYDISGALQTNIDGKDNYTKWVLQGDGATTTDIDSAETVQFTGAGNVSISLGGTDNRTVTISGNDVSSTYTAGTGLALVGTEFSTSGTGTFTQINFDLDATPSYNEGTIFYDNENKALAVYNDEADITLQLGQEQYVRVRNNTTGTISNGQAVYINGSQGGVGPTVELAISTGEATSQVIGLATHDIGTNSFGYVTSFGVVRDVDTSLFNDGDSVYLSEAVSGGLTGVSPVIPNYKAPIGHIIRAHPFNGTILVQIVAPKLGGGDAKVVNSDINLSGIPFYSVIADTNAGGMSSDPTFVYNSGNNQLQLGSGVQLLNAVPGNTTNVLYNNGGTLYFNGSAVDSDTTYTAGTGLQLVGTEFNVSGIDSSMIVDGSVANGDLANDSVTVTAGSGLSNGGEVDLGATITLDITPGGVTNDMLGGSIANDKLSNSAVSYGGVSVSLGASDATPAFNLTDATGYPTSSLVGTITNAQLAGSIDNSKLSNSSVTITAGTGLSNGGAVSLGSSVTIDADTASTSQVGVVQLQDSATDGTTDKAITPNAVYDISGVLQSGIDGAGGASDLNDLGDVSYGGTNLTYTILINNNPGSAPSHGTLGSDNARNLGIGYLALSSITDASDNIVLGGFAGWQLTQGDRNVFVGPEAGTQITDGDHNICIGYQTQYYGNGGDYNIAIGSQALRGNTDGTTTTNNLNNIGIGQQALYRIEDGDSNVAIGYKSANEIKDGQQNVAIGYQAQLYDESCDHNVAVGRDALRGTTSSANQQYNTAVGAGSLYTVTTGGYNTSVGGFAGGSLTTGSSNIFVGYLAGYGATATESDILYIGNDTVGNDGTIIKADMSEKHVAIGMADDHFSNSAGSATLQVYPKDNADPAILVKAVASPTTDAKALKVDDSTGTEVYSITAKGAIKSNIKSNTYGSTVTFDLDESNTHTVTLTGSPTLALSNVTAGQKFMVKLIQDGTGSHTVTWWSTIKWAGGTEPTLTTDPNKADTFGFLCTSSGNYDGFIVGQNI